MKIYLLTIGDGTDGDEWGVLGIYSTHDKALEAQAKYQRPRHRRDGSTYTLEAKVEEWLVDEPLEDRHDI